MNFLKTLTLVIIQAFAFISSFSFAQEESSWLVWPEGLGFSNHLEYSYNTDTDTEILEDWLNLDYSRGIFSGGLRLEVFQPNDPDPSISRGKNLFAEIDYLYIRADIVSNNEGLEVVAGNFYTLFGRGMVLKSYEDRAIRIDNNLLGLKVTGKYADFVLTALTGTSANILNERKDILHAVDLEFKGWKPLKFGTTVASNIPESEGISRTTMASFRAIPSFWNIDVYTEYTAKFNSDIKQGAFHNEESIAGQGFYGNLNIYFGPLSLLGEYKYYDNVAFTSQDGTIFYNTPPSVRQEYTYILPNRHPSPLNQNNEQGFQIAAGYNVSDQTYLNGAFTLTETLPIGSYYKRVLEDSSEIETQLKEVYFQAQHDWSYEFTTVLAFAYNEENATKTKNITPILENRFYFSDVNTIKLTLEHQHSTLRTTNEQFYTDVLSIEYLRSPKFNVSLVAELETREPEEGKTVRKFWGFVQAGYKIGNHTDISVLVGTRQAGNICIGGVCRFEPAFKGIEVKLLTRL